MAQIKCESCGDDLVFSANAEIAACASCGRHNTRPRLLDDQRTALLNRANALRLRNDYDNAVRAFEGIIQQDVTEHKAYWGLVLCHYGIDYVEEGGRRVPTFRRLSHDPILEHPDYANAVTYSDGTTRNQYQHDAAEIAAVQQRVLEVAGKAAAYDVFICYKETDAAGNRTRESGDAQDLYYFLEKNGLRVFFSRVTLKGKLGTEFEPYIFAALQSAKVMLVVGTCAENLNALWVKNEWSRYLELQRKDRSRMLVSCYRNIRAEGLPEELRYLQSLDLAELHATDTLLANIRRVIPEKRVSSATHTSATAVAADQAQNLLTLGCDRAELGEFEQADRYFDRVLEIDRTVAPAYIGKVLCQHKLKTCSDLTEFISFEGNSNFKLALKYADGDYKATLDQLLQRRRKYLDEVERQRQEKMAETERRNKEAAAEAERRRQEAERHRQEAERRRQEEAAEAERRRQETERQRQETERQRQEAIYQDALRKLRVATTTGDLDVVEQMFASINGYKSAGDFAYLFQDRRNTIANQSSLKRRLRELAFAAWWDRIVAIVAALLVVFFGGCSLTGINGCAKNSGEGVSNFFSWLIGGFLLIVPPFLMFRGNDDGRKSSFWMLIPLVLAGVFWCCLGGCDRFPEYQSSFAKTGYVILGLWLVLCVGLAVMAANSATKNSSVRHTEKTILTTQLAETKKKLADIDERIKVLFKEA